MTPAELEAAVLDGDPEGALRMLRRSTESERRTAAPIALRLRKKHGQFGGFRTGETELDGQRRVASLVALYGTAPPSELRLAGWVRHEPFVWDALMLRPPEVLTALVPWLVETFGWQRVRGLVRAGTIPTPECDEYISGMVGPWLDVRELVAEDPALLEREVWRLFEVEGTQECNLASHDKFHPRTTWADFLVERAAGDPAMRARLLDASLAALERDFGAFRAGWFSRFHEQLEPTLDERAARRDVYLRLVRSPVGPTVALAVQALDRLQRAGRLDPADLLPRIGPALTAPAAATATTALRLLERIGDRAARQVAAGALANRSTQVQGAALQMLEDAAGPDESLAGAIRPHLDDVAASLRARCDALLSRLDPGSPEVAPLPLPRPDGLEAPARSVARDPFASLEPVVPIATLPELCEALAGVLEIGGPPDEVERVLDAIVRLSPERPHDFDRLVGAVYRRASKIQEHWLRNTRGRHGAYADGQVPVNLAAIVVAWVTGDARPLDGEWRLTLGRYLAERLAEIARLAASRTGVGLLAAPTYRGGWIEPLALAERLRRRVAATPDEDAFRMDMAQALLRLLPGRRHEALAAARRLQGESAAALRHALGETVPVGTTRSLWVAAARARCPDGDDPAVEAAFPGLGPDAGLAGTFRLGINAAGHASWASAAATPHATLVHSDCPTTYLWDPRRHAYDTIDRAAEPFVSWLGYVWPQSRRSWCVAGAARFVRNLPGSEVDWPLRLYLEPLFDPSTDVGPEACLLVAAAMQGREPGERGMAVEAARTLIADGRLDGEALASGLDTIIDALPAPVEGAYSNPLRPKRLAASLAELAATSALHAREAQEAAARVVASLIRPPAEDTAPLAPLAPVVPVAQVVPLLRLLVELRAVSGRATPSSATLALAALARGTGEAARLARELRPSGSSGEARR